MPPHMTEVQRPQSVRNMTPTGTSTSPKPVPVKTGIETVEVTGEKMPTSTKRMATEATTESCDLLETLPPMMPPTRRPHIIRNQYVPTSEPAAAAAMPAPSVVEVRKRFMKLGMPTSTPT